MRHALALAAAFAALSTLGAAPASASPYKWCAVSSVGGQNCGFVTIKQCRMAISGDNRATCILNGHYDGRWDRRGW